MSLSQSAKVNFTDPSSDAYARFISANGTVVTLTSATQKVLLQYVMQYTCTFGNQFTNQVIAATLGRGNTSTPTTAYVNLANGVKFNAFGGEVFAAITNSDASTLATSLSQRFVAAALPIGTINMVTVDQPGAGTFYYAARVATSADQVVAVRNSYLVPTVVGA